MENYAETPTTVEELKDLVKPWVQIDELYEDGGKILYKADLWPVWLAGFGRTREEALDELAELLELDYAEGVERLPRERCTRDRWTQQRLIDILGVQACREAIEDARRPE